MSAMRRLMPSWVLVVGRDISFGSRPIANSVCELLVAPMFTNSYETLFAEVVKPTSNHDLGLSRQDSIASDLKGLEGSGTRWKTRGGSRISRVKSHSYQAPTGILTGPEEHKRRRLTQPATILIKLQSIQAQHQTRKSWTHVSWRISFWTSFSSQLWNESYQLLPRSAGLGRSLCAGRGTWQIMIPYHPHRCQCWFSEGCMCRWSS